MNQNLVKLDRFNETNFTRWQDKMIFTLIAVKIHYVLGFDLTPIPNQYKITLMKSRKNARNESRMNCYVMDMFFDHLDDLYTYT